MEVDLVEIEWGVERLQSHGLVVEPCRSEKHADLEVGPGEKVVFRYVGDWTYA